MEYKRYVSNYVVLANHAHERKLRGIYVWIVCLPVIYNSQSIQYTVWLSIIVFLLYLFRAWIKERERNGIKLVFYLQIEDIWKGKKLNIDNSQLPYIGQKKTNECEAVYVLTLFCVHKISKSLMFQNIWRSSVVHIGLNLLRKNEIRRNSTNFWVLMSLL